MLAAQVEPRPFLKISTACLSPDASFSASVVVVVESSRVVVVGSSRVVVVEVDSVLVVEPSLGFADWLACSSRKRQAH